MPEPVEVQRLRQMLKAARPLLRELAIACARAEEELDRMNAQPRTAEEAQHGHIHNTDAPAVRVAAHI